MKVRLKKQLLDFFQILSWESQGVDVLLPLPMQILKRAKPENKKENKASYLGLSTKLPLTKSTPKSIYLYIFLIPNN